VECGHMTRPTTFLQDGSHHWEDLVRNTLEHLHPKVVFESWIGQASIWPEGPTCKSTTTRWQKLGYETRNKTIKATRIGGAIDQERLLVVRISLAGGPKWH
jgi:hypothetical protein